MVKKTYYLRTDFFLRHQNNGKYETKMAILRLFLAEKRPGFVSGSELRLFSETEDGNDCLFCLISIEVKASYACLRLTLVTSRVIINS